MTLAAAVRSDKALSDDLTQPGASKGIVFFGPQRAVLPLPENWVWSVGLESRLITDGKRTLAFSVIPWDDLVYEAGEAQTSQLLPPAQRAGALGLDPLAHSPVQTSAYLLPPRWVVLVL